MEEKRVTTRWRSVGKTLTTHPAADEAAAVQCSHLHLIRDLKPGAEVCEQCVASGDTWVHLRMCLVCGHVGCCDQSKNKHATRHYHETGHPVMQALDGWADWGWCYADVVYLSTRGIDDE
jgi:uncharacterized UBP type Zn finger protein